MALTDYDKQYLSAEQQADILKHTQAWDAAHARGDELGKKAAHEAANAVRTAHMRPAGQDYIRDIFNQQLQARQGALESAYNQNVNALAATREKIPATYQAAQNQVAGQSAIQQQNFNEYAAARGLNTGASGQAALARGNVLQGNLASLSQAQSDALSSIDLQRAQLETAYKSDIANAVAENNASKAQALYSEYMRAEQALAAARQTAADEAYRQQTLGMSRENQEYERQLAAANAAYKLYGDTSALNSLYGITPPSTSPPSASPPSTSPPSASPPSTSPTQNYRPIADVLAGMKAAGQPTSVILQAIKDAYASGDLATSDYMTLYNKYRG